MSLDNLDLRIKKNYGNIGSGNNNNIEGSQQINQARNELASIMQSSNSTQEQKTQVQIEAAQTDAEQQSQLQEIQGNLQASITAIAAATQNVNSATANLTTANSEVASAQSALSGADPEGESYSGLVANYQAALAKQAEAMAQLEAAQAELDAANNTKEEIEAKLEEVKTTIDQTKAQNDAELAELQATIENYEAQATNLEQEISQLEQEQQDAQAQAQADQEQSKEVGGIDYDPEKAQEEAKAKLAALPGVTYNPDGTITRTVLKNGEEVVETVTIDENGQIKATENKAATDLAKTQAATEAQETQETEELADAAEKAHVVDARGADGNDGGLDASKADQAYEAISSHQGFFIGDWGIDKKCTIAGIRDIVNNSEWKVNVNGEDKKLVDAIVDSFDSELDLYIEAQVQAIISAQGGLGGTTKFDNSGFLSEDSIRQLAAKGIRVDAIGSSDGNFSNRVYSFSLVDMSTCPEGDEYNWLYNTEEGMNAKVLVDDNGNEGSIILSDCVIPDGYYQGAEIELSSILDAMGADCFTKYDFIGKEDEYRKLIADVEARLQSGGYESGQSMSDLYGYRKSAMDSKHDLWLGRGYTPGKWGLAGGDSGGLSDLVDELAGDSETSDSSSSSSSSEKASRSKLYNQYLKEGKEQYKQKNGVEASGADMKAIIEAASKKADEAVS